MLLAEGDQPAFGQVHFPAGGSFFKSLQLSNFMSDV